MTTTTITQAPQGKYPAKQHVKRSLEQMRSNANGPINGVLYFESTTLKLQEDNDFPEHFRQRRFFFYLTGCNLADCYFVYDTASDKSTLFIPPVVAEEVIWSGIPLTAEDATKKYDVDQVLLTPQLNEFLGKLAAAKPDSTVYTIDDQVAETTNLSGFKNRDRKSAKVAIESCRVVKDEYEIGLIRKANSISCLGHEAVMRSAKTAKTEAEVEAAFRERCIFHNAKEVAYPPIVASGAAAGTLHYVDNSQPLQGKLNLLIDAGCEWDNYASDITRTIPLGGKFSPESKDIYDIVYQMITQTTNGLKAGVVYDELHILAHKILIDGFLKLGIFVGDKDEILAARTSTAFLPHGLGHHLGMDCHDVGGNANRADEDKLFPNLRLRGTVPANSVVTIEPGIYFCKFIIQPFLEDPAQSKYINTEVLNKYWEVGGIRLEDNILVTASGFENLTTAPLAIDQVEAMAA